MKIQRRIIVSSTMIVCVISSIIIYTSNWSNQVHFYKISNWRNHTIFANQSYHKPEERKKPLLTIFTTVKEFGIVPHHQLAFNIVMTNWPSFAPYIRPVVFLDFTNSSLADEARLAGWDILSLEGVNEAGTPLLKDMFQTVFDRYESVFYGFANGDILFDDSILKTLWGVQRKLKGLNNNVLVMGVRTNVDVDMNETVLIEEFEKHRLRDLAARKGKLFADDAIDYFFFTKEGCSLNWSQLADVVVGRPAYDNYLVAMAIRYKVNVIDATNTVLAVHISEPRVFSHGGLNKDSNYNKKIIGNFNYHNGLASSADLATTKDALGDVFIIRRRKKK